MTITISYDKLGRVKQTKLHNNMFSKTLNYLQKGDHASNLVSSEWFGKYGVIKDSLKYTYDDKGNITKVLENGIEITRYTYDNLSRLIREDNKKLNKTTTFSYDNGGNILNKLEYAYTLIQSDLLQNGTVTTYEYASEGWRDQLKTFNGQTINYDILGNPVSYLGKTLTWAKGRRLTSFDGKTYTYNANGIRLSKTHLGLTTHFYLDGSNIIMQETGSENLFFHYKSDGISGFTRNGSAEYIYKKNIQGDIIGIFDSTGQEIVKYVYDAWGNHKTYVLNDTQFVDISIHTNYTTSGTLHKAVATLNPFRYRGYYYDTETNLYYLNSRYYDPQTVRFISADDLTYLDPQTLNGLNLYAYCGNNPVMNIDPNGNKWWHWVVGGLIIAVAAALTVVTAGGFAAAGAAIFGAIGIGSATAGTAGLFASITIGSIIAGGTGIILGGLTSIINGENFWDGAASGFMWGSISGAISAAFGYINFDLGDLYGSTHKLVGNIYQIVGQSFIANIVYTAETLFEKRS